MLEFEINKQAPVKISFRRLKEAAAAFEKHSKLSGRRYFSLALVDNPTIKRLNYSYRGKNSPTDVLSFSEAEVLEEFSGQSAAKDLGEIIISVPEARKQASQAGCSLTEELIRLLVHGLAHLIGYRHQDVPLAEAAEMDKFQNRVLAELAVKTK